jgi:DNA-binding response OmpR family regulator
VCNLHGIAMNEPDNFALVPKPPGALERAEPGAKRILSGMVADTLALANAPRGLRVIILDDEEGPRESYKIILNDYFKNLEVREFTNGNEAWTELSRTHPGLFITDLRHLGLDCFEMLRRLAESRASFPIFVITAFETPDSLRLLREFENAGLNLTYMHKPITVQQFRGELLKHFGTVEQSQNSPVAPTFRIGGYDWCEPDYRQILNWAAATKLTPEEAVAALFDGNSDKVDDDGRQLRFLAFFEEPLFANAKMLKLSWDLRQLPCSSVEWVDGLAITHLRFFGDLTIGAEPKRSLSSIGTLPLASLVWLSCRWQNLSTLDLSGVPQLQHLHCNCNRLRSLKLDAVRDLGELDCGFNEIEALDFANTRKLLSLSCEGNCLGTLDLSGLSQLGLIRCDGCYLTELNTSELPSLQYLSCAGNQLRNLDLSQIPSLNYLDCSSNQIQRLDLSKCSQITFLDCQGNPIRELDITPLEQLETLNYDAGKTNLIQREDQHFD